MNKIEDEVRELLQRKSRDLPPHLDVPKAIKGRVRRRIALNALAVGMTLALVAVGAFAGLRSLGVATNDEPANQPKGTSLPSIAPTPTSRGGQMIFGEIPCTSGQLRAVGTMEGAAGSRFGTVQLTNFSGSTCTLTGRPTITFLDANLQPITDGVDSGPLPAGWRTNAQPKPTTWPLVTLRPGGVASVRVGWSNWCPQGRPTPLWRLAIPGSAAVDVNGFDAVDPPPCNGPGLPSTIDVGPFEPNLSP